MSERKVRSQELQQFLAPVAARPQFNSAFEALGFWTLGVVLMRNLRFSLKSLLIFITMLVPLLLTFGLFTKEEIKQIDASKLELSGVEYLRAFWPVYEASLQLMKAAHLINGDKNKAGLAESQEKYQRAWQALEQTDKTIGARFNLSSKLQAIQVLYQKALSEKSAEAAFLAHKKHLKALLELLDDVVDGSELSLDPEAISYHLMTINYFRFPLVVEQSAVLQAVGEQALSTGQVKPEQLRELNRAIALISHVNELMGKDLKDVVEKSPELKSSLNFDATMLSTDQFIDFVNDNLVEAQNLSPENRVAFNKFGDQLLSQQFALSKVGVDILAQALSTRTQDMTNLLIYLIVTVFVFILIAIYFFIAFYRVTDGGLQLTRHHLNEVAKGDLRHPPANPWGKDETADVITDLQKTYKALHELIRTVRHSARALHGTTKEIARASLDLSGRSESAASTLEEQAAAMEEIGSTVQNSTEKANKAASFAANNASVAEEGGHIIKSVVDTMHQIQTSSGKVSDIISVIDGIAFQTNILALNAAVEAARAGEAGRGFAVVASEVRSLAHRSADAAKEIKRLISDSVEQIDGGIDVVEKAGTTMVTIVENAKQISAYLAEISAGAREQATGIAQVANSINELDDHTQQNAALVEQTSAACDALTQQAESMQKDIANFIVA